MYLIFLIISLLGSSLAVTEPDESTITLHKLASNLDDPVAIYASGGGNIYVVDQGRNRFLKFNHNGQRLDSLGRLGSGDYRFDQPRDIDATNDLKIYVSDYQNRRIQMYDRRLQYISTAQLPRRAGVSSFSPTSLSVNRSGELFFFDQDNHRIYKFGINGSYESHFSTRSGADIRRLAGLIALDDLYLADPDQNVVHRMSSNGTYLGFIPVLEGIKGIAAHNNKLWVLSEYSVNVFTPGGRRLHRFQIENDEDLRDIAVYRDHIYFIGYDALYKAQRISVN